MPHDGQDLPMTETGILPDLLATTAAALPAVEDILERAKQRVAEITSRDGKVAADLIEDNQTAAHGLAWIATYAEALRQMQHWAETLETTGKFSEIEQLIHQIAFGEYLWQIYGGIPKV